LNGHRRLGFGFLHVGALAGSVFAQRPLGYLYTPHGSSLMPATKLAPRRPLPFQLSLRIRHPSMDPAVISKELGIEPEHSFRAGESRQSRSGVAPAAFHTESYWLAPLNPASWLGNPSFAEPRSLAIMQKHIDAAVAQNLAGALGLCATQFKSAHAALLHTIRSEGGETSLLVTLAPSDVDTFSLPPHISRVFGDLGVTLEFEMTDD
jgi:hypothetical protein